MDAIEMVERLAENEVRTERVIWVPGAIAAGSIPEDLSDFLDDVYPYEKYQPKILKTLPQLAKLLEDMGDDPLEECEDLIFEYLQGVEGFFVQLATPVKNELKNGAYSFSWGVYQTEWFYVRTMEELVYASTAFAEGAINKLDSTEKQE